MDYFEFLNLPKIHGVSEKQKRYAETLRDKEVHGNRDYYEAIACKQYHRVLNYSDVDETTRIVLSCGNAGVIIDALKNE